MWFWSKKRKQAASGPKDIAAALAVPASNARLLSVISVLPFMMSSLGSFVYQLT